MTLTINLTSVVESRLLAEAQEQGMSLEAYAEHLLVQHAAVWSRESGDSALRAASFERWARTRPARRSLPPKAFQREQLVREGE